MTTDPCVHCGFCLPTCASYRVLGTEMDSPRGRIYTLKAIANGELSLDATVASTTLARQGPGTAPSPQSSPAPPADRRRNNGSSGFTEWR